jgi:hypothetical protein
MRAPKPTRVLIAVAATLAAGSGLIGAPAGAAPSTDLFISEYVEGTGDNKAIEIYNGTGSTIDLANYYLEFFGNGSSTPTGHWGLSQYHLHPGTVWVGVHPNASAQLQALADDQILTMNFDGNDTIRLVANAGAVLDTIGQVGFDPGLAWGTNPTTRNTTLRRTGTIANGDSNSFDAFDPALEWYGHPADTFDGLGHHSVGEEIGSVTATVAVSSGACLQLSTNAVSFGTLALGSESKPATPSYTITNCAGVPGTLLASGTDATGPSALWTLDDTAATCTGTPPLAGDRYHLYDERGATSVALSTGNKTIHTAVPPGVPFTHRLSISTACPGSSGSGKTMSMRVDYTATG